MTRTAWPMAVGGRLRRNWARTMPPEPCARVTLPQMTRNLDPTCECGVNPRPAPCPRRYLVLLVHAVNVRDPLAKVKGGVLLRLDVLQAQQRRLRLLVPLAALVPGENALDVQADRLRGLGQWPLAVLPVLLGHRGARLAKVVGVTAGLTSVNSTLCVCARGVCVHAP